MTRDDYLALMEKIASDESCPAHGRVWMLVGVHACACSDSELDHDDTSLIMARSFELSDYINRSR